MAPKRETWLVAILLYIGLAGLFLGLSLFLGR